MEDDVTGHLDSTAVSTCNDATVVLDNLSSDFICSKIEFLTIYTSSEILNYIGDLFKVEEAHYQLGWSLGVELQSCIFCLSLSPQ